jgi:excisionase family DNA binding protein
MPRLKSRETMLGSCGAARYLGLHRSTITYWRRKGELTPTAVVESPRGPQYRFSVADLDKFRERIDFDA